MQLADGSTAETLAGITSRFAAVRLSREGPVPVVVLERRLDAPGGAANAARNAAALGARPTRLRCRRRRHEGNRLRSILADAGVDVAGKSRRTLDE